MIKIPFPKRVTDPFKLVVAIPCYNEAGSIGETVDSVLNQTRPPDAVIVGDDQSTDETKEIALAHGAYVITHEKRQGNKAFNQQAIVNSSLFKELTNGFDTHNILLIIIDGDTTIHPEGFEKLIAPFEDEKVTASSGYIIPWEVKSIWQHARLVEYHYSLNLQKSVQNDLGMNLVVSGCFCAIRLSSLYHHGGFATNTITEDFGLTCQQHLEKERIKFIRDAICYTKEPSSMIMMAKQLDRWYRGFFQTIAIHKRGILTCRNGLLTMFVGMLFLEGLVGIISPFCLLYLFYKNYFTFITQYWYMSFIAEISIVVIPATYGSLKHHQFWMTITSVPCFYLLRILMMFVCWRSFLLEWVFQKKLMDWNKGH